MANGTVRPSSSQRKSFFWLPMPKWWNSSAWGADPSPPEKATGADAFPGLSSSSVLLGCFTQTCFLHENLLLSFNGNRKCEITETVLPGIMESLHGPLPSHVPRQPWPLRFTFSCFSTSLSFYCTCSHNVRCVFWVPSTLSAQFYVCRSMTP